MNDKRIMEYADPEMRGPLGKPVPTWAWLIGILFFPPGVFIVLGMTRLLSWKRSILLAIASYASCVILIPVMIYLQNARANNVIQVVASFAFLILFLIWGWIIYRIGDRTDYWSPKTRRGWRHAGWFVVALLALSVISISMQMFPGLWKPIFLWMINKLR